MSYSINKKKTLYVRLQEASFSTDVIPFLLSYTLNDLLSTDWYALCKFNEPIITQWMYLLIKKAETIADPAKKREMGVRINDFFAGNKETTGLKPVHVAINANNTSILELILDYTHNQSPVASFLVHPRTGDLVEYVTGTEPLMMDVDDYGLTDYAIKSGNPEILKILMRRNLINV